MYNEGQPHTIQQLSVKLNIPKPTLRFWEKEFEGILIPLRTSGGQRRYTSENVSIIKEIKFLKKAGFSLIEIKRKLKKRQVLETGGRKAGDDQPYEVDLLAEKVAAVVRKEVLRFLKGEES